MLATFRRGLNTWVAKLFFIVLIGSFGIWGVADVFRNLGASDGSVATVGGHKIEMAEVQDIYRRQLAQVSRMFGGKIEPTPEIRRSVAAQSIDRVITQTALDEQVRALGIVASDEAVRQSIYDIPSLRGPDGTFSRANLDMVLRNNNLSEARFLTIMRSDLAQRQLLEAVEAGAAVSDVETKAVFAFQNEKRVAEAVEFAFAAAAEPAAATDARLQRWYENHPEAYRTPETRRIKAVILSAETVGRDIEVSDDDLKTAWEQHRGEFEQPEKRSVDVVTAPDEAKAATLAKAWEGGADWAAMEAQAKAAGASTVELNAAVRAEFPDPDLAEAVFKAKQGTVEGPVKAAFGFYVVKVTAVTGGGGKTFEQARDELRARVIADKAADLVDSRANKVDQLLAGGTSLDELPADLGLAAVQGTLDAQGNTAEGVPAPIPGPASLRPALIQAAFQAKPGDPPRLTQAPNDANNGVSYFAFQVEQVTPPAEKPFATVAETVKADWTKDAIRHEQEAAAAKMLASIKGGQSMEDAATIEGVTMRKLPATGRSEPAEGVPAQLIQPLFGLKKGEPTMIETPDGFIIAVLSDIEEANPDTDPVGFGRIREALNKALGQDIQATYAAAVRDRERPKVNPASIDQLAQAE